MKGQNPPDYLLNFWRGIWRQQAKVYCSSPASLLMRQTKDKLDLCHISSPHTNTAVVKFCQISAPLKTPEILNSLRWKFQNSWTIKCMKHIWPQFQKHLWWIISRINRRVRKNPLYKRGANEKRVEEELLVSWNAPKY